jgi:hypothetical protein
MCTSCKQLREELFTPGYSRTFGIEELKIGAETTACDLCTLLWHTVKRNAPKGAKEVRLSRSGSFLRLKDSGPPVLSIVRNPKQRYTGDFQIGHVGLPEAKSATHLGQIRYWLKHCDKFHESACRSSNYNNKHMKFRLPTRLIDVTNIDDGKVRLWETSPNDTGEWIALSHRWGKPEDGHFSTTRENIQQHLDGISLTGPQGLPATFRDAVYVTHKLGLKYLWIDSLCVVQGKDGDFRTEAKRMEEVYSGAYCVIAANSATNHFSGFLKPRNPRAYVGMCREGKGQAPFYLCQAVDNFKEHVLESELATRGWVLQERALARRTVFFTEHQTYFECGSGIQCETSTRLSK